MAREKSVPISVSEFWLDKKPKYTRRFKPLPLGTICKLWCTGRVVTGKVKNYLYPNYVYKNTNPWILRYEFEDINDPNHGYIVDYYSLTEVKINGKFEKYELEKHYYDQTKKYVGHNSNGASKVPRR